MPGETRRSRPARTGTARRPRRGSQERVVIIPTPPMPVPQGRVYDPGWDTTLEPRDPQDVPDPYNGNQATNTITAINNIYVDYGTATINAPQYYAGGLGLFRDPPTPRHRFKPGQMIILDTNDYEGAINRGTKLLIVRVRDSENYETIVQDGGYKGKELYISDRQVRAAIKPRNLPSWF